MVRETRFVFLIFYKSGIKMSWHFQGPFGPLVFTFCGSSVPWWEKMGILARSLPGNLSIWREILTFEIKKYIRNSGKSDFLAGKNTFFQAVVLTKFWGQLARGHAYFDPWSSSSHKDAFGSFAQRRLIMIMAVLSVSFRSPRNLVKSHYIFT